MRRRGKDRRRIRIGLEGRKFALTFLEEMVELNLKEKERERWMGKGSLTRAKKEEIKI
jgi:hypothetical protein